jgi:NTP pyrophosphatase (non-canonical NTP hydrolase)
MTITTDNRTGAMSESFQTLELKVLRWAEARKIIPNSNPLAQAIKTLEEVSELLTALNQCSVDREWFQDEARDAYGDILVTLIIGADLLGTDLRSCLDDAYEMIKDRKGYLTSDGIFVKEESK